MERYDLMTIAEVASALGMDESTVRRRIRRGDMQAVRAGARVWLIPREEVDRWRVIGRLKPGPKPRRRPEENQTETGEEAQ